MAFVFRSPKRSLFQQQSTSDRSEVPLSNAGQQNSIPKKDFSLSKVCKGFSSNSEVYSRLMPKQKNKLQMFPIPEGTIIHQNDKINQPKPLFYLNQTLKNTLTEQTQQKSVQSKLQNILSIKETQNYDKNLMDFKIFKESYKKYRQPLNQPKQKKQSVYNQKIRSQQKFLNKSLSKTISLLAKKETIEEESNKLSFLYRRQNVNLTNNQPKAIHFKSLKKLSPLKWQFSKQSEEQQKKLQVLLSTNYKPQSLDNLQAKQLKPKIKLIAKLQSNLKQNMQEQYQQSEDEYDVSATPGPGSYSIESWQPKKQFRSKKQKFRKMFYSPLQRFQKNGNSQQGQVIQSTFCDQSSFNEPKTNICSSFLSKSPRFIEKQQIYSPPPPGYYDTRQTLEHDLMRNILKSSNSTVFINCDPPAPRKKQIEYSPGPGSYHVDSILQKLNEEHGQPSYIYKSKILRNNEAIEKQPLKEQLNPLVKKKNKQNISPIHVQDSSYYSNYVNDIPPFLSTSQRFPEQGKSLNGQLFYPKVCRRQQKIVDNKEGFNSSSQRDMEIQVQPGVSIGLYNVAANHNWNKKSFNVLFS